MFVLSRSLESLTVTESKGADAVTRKPLWQYDVTWKDTSTSRLMDQVPQHIDINVEHGSIAGNCKWAGAAWDGFPSVRSASNLYTTELT